MAYQIRYTEAAKRDLRTLPGNYRQRVHRLIESLPATPRPRSAKELRDRPNRFRIRVNGWRLVYRIDEDEETILVLRVRRKAGPATYEDIE